jgi:hypothetical protein
MWEFHAGRARISDIPRATVATTSILFGGHKRTVQVDNFYPQVGGEEILLDTGEAKDACESERAAQTWTWTVSSSYT